MRRIAPFVALLLAFVTLRGAGAAPAQPVQSRNLTGQGSVTTTDGCIQTYTEVFVVDSWNHQPHGGPADVTSATVEVTQTDTCTGTPLHHIIVASEGVDFSADNQLRSGELTATFTNFRDLVTEAIVDLTVSVTWTGTEDVTTSRAHEVINTDDGRLNVQTTYSERVGTMTIDISGGIDVHGSGFGFLGLTENQSVRVPGA